MSWKKKCRTSSPPEPYVEELGVGNSRRTNIVGFAYRRANFLQVPALDLSVGVRVEDSKTNSKSIWNYHASGGYMTRSRRDEVRIAEVLRLVYKGIKQTTLSFDADLEQRDLEWHARDAYSPANFDRDVDIDFTDQIYTLKAVHRFNRAVKSTVKFRIKDLERSYTTLFDDDPADYPSYLGSYRRRGNDLTVKTDFRINSKTSTTLMYQFVQESIDFSMGGKTSNIEIHRGAGSISCSPRENLFVVGTFMLENYDLDTPAYTSSLGSRRFDFRGNSYTLMLDGAYAFNEKTSCTLGFRHTEALGTVDYAGDYVYDKVGLTLSHKLAKNRTVGLGYQFINYNNHGDGSWDDYKAHGIFTTYTFTF